MKYNFGILNSNLNYLKNVMWFRYQFTKAKENKKITSLNVLFKNKDFLVIEKPYDMQIYDFSGYKSTTVLDLLRENFPFYYNPKIQGGYHVLHRLDYMCSGCFCVPLNEKSAQLASDAIRKGEIEKKYLALVNGHLKRENNQNEFEIEASIEDDLENRGHAMAIGNIDAKNSVTKVKILEYGTYNNEPSTKLLLEPITGRRHQLRLQLKHIGFPIIGDLTYGNHRDYQVYRAMLHAYSFKLKISNKKIVEAKGRDYFLNEIDSFWKPELILNKI
jgi:23S rRNA-/tRNA-specific pseudouridylate synthase